jgi:hypothetical protein
MDEYDMNKTEAEIMWEKLKAAKKRIAELEAERDQARFACVDRNQQITELQAQNAALVAASASGQGVRMEPPLIKEYVDPTDFNVDAVIMTQNGYSMNSWRIIEREHMYAVMWQRPARPESEGNE